jgi:signal transduction histidine kinase
MTLVDLNEAVRNTLTMTAHEYKYVADVETDFGDLPPVRCHVGFFNQAVLNVIVNAAHAVADAVRGAGRGTITVRTYREALMAVVAISDTGLGMAPEVARRVFEPFFTTKEVGRGTGQGLAIARSVFVEKHGGDITFETAEGIGTTFYLRIPIESADGAASDGGGAHHG